MDAYRSVLCSPRAPRASVLLFGLLALTTHCTGDIGNLPDDSEVANAPAGPAGSAAPSDSTDAPPPPFSPASPVLARLTAPQYDNVIRDLFGSGAMSHDLEPDARPYLFSVIGAAMNSVSELGVDLYARAAYDFSAMAFADAGLRNALAPCSMTVPLTDACLTAFIHDFGQRAFRRPLNASEQDVYHQLRVGLGLADPVVTLSYVAAAILQSPNFLYRVELGEPAPDHPGWLRYTSYEMASRLSFLLRNTGPDSELLAAASRGDLVTRDGILKQANRLLEQTQPSRDQVSRLYNEYLDLPGLGGVDFPADIDPQRTLGASMKSEVLALVDRVAVDESGDLRTLFSTRTTSIDNNLATFYGLPAIASEETAVVTLPGSGPRAGLLTTGALMAMNNRPNRTAPTLRGHFVRERLLCGTVPPPPPNVPPIMEDNQAAPQTLRQKLEAHRKNPACAGCHQMMDPLGLGMEDFDRYGRYRTVDDTGAPIDDSGDLDGTTFHGARELDQLLAGDARTMSCLATQLYRYASARIETPEEEIVLQEIDKGFADSGYQYKALVVALVASDGFRYLKSEVP
jgi:Protein of unknown function (DUF1588)/Protein of unknown function (DUF1592)/Protein of unknown function (DUF1585)/Protein of unknown function (DUF1595)/Protein of unknown function (DUF1587)